MAIAPIDISMMQRMNDVAQIKQNELTRPDVQQNVITHEVQKEVNIRSEHVVKKDDANKSDTEHDAREKGKNEYFFTGNKNKKKSEENGKVTIKGNNSFDIKI